MIIVEYLHGEKGDDLALGRHDGYGSEAEVNDVSSLAHAKGIIALDELDKQDGDPRYDSYELQSLVDVL